MKASKWMYNVMFALATVLFLPLGLMANNIRIIGIPSVVKNNDKKTAAINFTLAWDNSWKSSKPANWDAAWIFVKCWDGDQWNHVYLEETGHTPGKPDAAGYMVRNRPGSVKRVDNCPMTIEVGKSRVWRKWHVDPAEQADTGVVGVFLYRKDSLGSGNIVVPGISLKWDYTTQGFVYDDDLVVKVFAIEMVYVPTGPFWVGGKGVYTKHYNSFTAYGQNFGYPFRVTSEAPITINSDANQANLGIMAGSYNNGTLPAKWPKGYQAFYIMKYELSQQGYCDFLNTLDQGRQNGRIYAEGSIESLGRGGSYTSWGSNGGAWWRNYVEVAKRSPQFVFGVDANNNGVCDETVMVHRTIDGVTDSCPLSIDGQDIAMNMVNMDDLLAYADFAGLRPMTELEYEKACRGDQDVRNEEFAWGSANIVFSNGIFHGTADQPMTHTSAYGYLNLTRGDETIPGDYNAGVTKSWDTHSNWWWKYAYYGPLRVGLFADSTTTRAEAGASYWGVMNMSDNCNELCVNACWEQHGRRFQGVHGDGQLRADGYRDETRWEGDRSWAFYVPRGIRVWHHNYNDWKGVSCGTPITSHWDHGNNRYEVWGGTISSRWYYNHGKDMNNRDPNTWMYGIRCVRTSGAAD